MREQIAMLDGLSGLGVSDPYVQDYSGYDSMRETTPVPGGGQNRTGGADWFDRAPYMLQQEGLAGLGALSMEPYGYAGSRTGPVPGNGQNYNGGSSWAPGFPTMPSSEGLASGALTMDEVPGYAGRVITPVPGNGQNYTGGADWAPGFPTSVSSRGLVALRRLQHHPHDRRGAFGGRHRSHRRVGDLARLAARHRAQRQERLLPGGALHGAACRRQRRAGAHHRASGVGGVLSFHGSWADTVSLGVRERLGDTLALRRYGHAVPVPSCADRDINSGIRSA